jgi:tetratricopeptide (TPR) repeat protein
MPKNRQPKSRKGPRTVLITDLLAAAPLADLLGAENGSDEIERAQELIYDAWEAPDRRRRIALAKKALKISPLCADAYTLLAQEAAKESEEELDLYRRGVEAGEKGLGEDAFVEEVGHFWGILEARPYMRARHGLALSLWAHGMREEALAHFKEMLRLNPNDNQGVRYLLLNRLLELGRDYDVAKLLKAYRDDGSAQWLYSAALADFRRFGNVDVSRKSLARAVKMNPHVPDYLCGKKKMPRELPSLVSWGGADEAIAYVHDAHPAWAAASGALAWAEDVAGGVRLKRRGV